MPTIPKYVCTNCGRGFTSARSARRHVASVESGVGQVIAEEDYRIGLQTGRIPAPIPKQIRPPRVNRLKMIDIAKEEFQRGYYRKLGEKFCEMAEDGPNLLMMLNVLQEIDRSSDDDAAKKIFMNMSENFKHNKK